MSELRPMLATSGELPTGPGWSYELKLDGIRALLEVDADGQLSIHTRNGNNVTTTFPELALLADGLAGNSAVLDGEIVAFNDEGKPSFHRLQERLGVFGLEAERRMHATPVVFVVFDILALNGIPTVNLPLTSRRAVLDQLDGLSSGPCWSRSTVHGDGTLLYQATQEAGLEGVMAKRDDSMYRPGQRSASWVKVKHLHTDEFVIGGWVPGEGRRESTIGALLLGIPESDKPGAMLRYIGKVGTGFSDSALDDLAARLAPDVIRTCPFVENPGERGAVFVKPRLRGNVAFGQWSPHGLLRFPTWKGLVD